MEKISFYVAGPFFNDEQLSSLETIEALLNKHNFSMFRPRIDAGKLDAHPTKEMFTTKKIAIKTKVK